MMEPVSRVYALLDEQGRILRIEGEYSLPDDLEDWTLVEQGAPCDRLNLAQSHYLEGGLYTEDGVLRWKYESGACVLRSEEEIAADRAAIPAPAPTQMDRVEAQAAYTAMMTDTLLEVRHEGEDSALVQHGIVDGGHGGRRGTQGRADGNGLCRNRRRRV